jgi:hypothetical protein
MSGRDWDLWGPFILCLSLALMIGLNVRSPSVTACCLISERDLGARGPDPWRLHRSDRTHHRWLPHCHSSDKGKSVIRGSVSISDRETSLQLLGGRMCVLVSVI